MNPSNVPIISHILESGAEDRVFDSLLLIGPLLIVIITVFHRSLVTELLATAYIVVFVTYILYQGCHSQSRNQ
ncbi:hypothetical protein E6P09_03425 [Haloferax mediterranei ATCC 33500]|uniref:Uncharacterized protein n=1 Tax=Haloferax mediterranei (strain ATCC 33500 / DSM 1411 / JCM 8866 / NBRC 14739 / NCIMB 2177 / R-4) TaxID=523841 RepID=M0J4I8_HALMT|nr:hypothetical protein BM92_08955 [Haloferax mediterranei ATCC 33500]EMA02919.1 hypothetical protein C439_10060 [Haloferax mediterranei ATCC 33500]QCQ74372.1 hypothetical protein E6P09_03425 [Haloferax mediterranei ATCC 33500]